MSLMPMQQTTWALGVRNVGCTAGVLGRSRRTGGERTDRGSGSVRSVVPAPRPARAGRLGGPSVHAAGFTAQLVSLPAVYWGKARHSVELQHFVLVQGTGRGSGIPGQNRVVSCSHRDGSDLPAWARTCRPK